MLNLILFGPPGAGKGTQALRLAEKYELMHISTGDILRKEISDKTELGLKVKSIMDKGELVSDKILIDILQSVIDRHPEVKGFIFDGFPRTIPQADALSEMLSSKGVSITTVIALAVDDEELIRRLLNRAIELGRSDDTEEVIRKRLEVYNAQTKPLLDYYREHGLLREVHGIGLIDEIFAELCRLIDGLNVH
jgi:adenylate kinase